MKNYNEIWQNKKVKLYCYNGKLQKVLTNIALLLLMLIICGIIIFGFSYFSKTVKAWMIAVSIAVPVLINYIIRRILFLRKFTVKFYKDKLALTANKNTYTIAKAEVGQCSYKNLLGGRLNLSIVYSGKTLTLREAFRKKTGGALLFDISEFLTSKREL